MSETQAETTGVVWILVDSSSREATFEGVAKILRDRGAQVHIVTMSEVLGTGLRDALSGGAERLLRGLRVAMRGRNQDEDLVGAIKRARPDLLAVTSAGHVRALGLLESVSGISSLQVGVFADYDFDPAWTRSSLHAFIVPHPTFADRLAADGVSRDRILRAGPAIADNFARTLDRDAEREKLGLSSARVVLVRAETLDTHLLEKLVFQGTLVDKDVRFVFHHNGDGAVASTLRRAAAQYGLKAAMFGKVDDLERYVVAADAVVASPRDPLVPEILALDRPLMLVGPDSEHGSAVEFLTSIGAALWVEDVLRLGSELERLLRPEVLAELSHAARDLSQTRGTEEVAEALLTALQNRHEWRQAPAPPQDAPPEGPASDDTRDDKQEDQPADSPFESIGDAAPTGSAEPSYAGISKAEAKDQLAALILSERDVEKRLAEAEKQQARWRGRLEMAREWQEQDLATEAEAILRGYLDEFEKLQAERAAILRQKDKLKEAALGGATNAAGPAGAASSDGRLADIEKRFRQMEVNSDLDDLKDRIRREMGD